MHPDRFAAWQAINNELFGNVDGDILLPSMKHLKRDLFGKIRALGLTPLREITFRVEQHGDFFTRNQSVVIGETRAVAIPMHF